MFNAYLSRRGIKNEKTILIISGLFLIGVQIASAQQADDDYIFTIIAVLAAKIKHDQMLPPGGFVPSGSAPVPIEADPTQGQSLSPLYPIFPVLASPIPFGQPPTGAPINGW